MTTRTDSANATSLSSESLSMEQMREIIDQITDHTTMRALHGAMATIHDVAFACGRDHRLCDHGSYNDPGRIIGSLTHQLYVLQCAVVDRAEAIKPCGNDPESAAMDRDQILIMHAAGESGGFEPLIETLEDMARDLQVD